MKTTAHVAHAKSRTEPCKGCSASVHVTDEQMKRLWERMSPAAEDLASAEEYSRRLEQCFSCEALQYGTTCRHCGCLVEWRAKLARSSCPYPASSRW
ncbi:DUF6171 family protein [Paenibacillus sp. SYP-B4298]|uniref:DUF6171 family protein n=1 Tax=Paenibacillus sp. SYP-B4298 TaxID=2996034 RepID=UPI0022DD219A|nr:DUF6171 family protein [Paenibacillus sp. SYP-B4298]